MTTAVAKSSSPLAQSSASERSLLIGSLAAPSAALLFAIDSILVKRKAAEGLDIVPGLLLATGVYRTFGLSRARRDLAGAAD